MTETPPSPSSPPAPEGDGLIETTLVRLFGRSYRTTLAGIVAVVAVVAAHTPGVPAWAIAALKELATLAAGAGLLIAKDSRVSGRS